MPAISAMTETPGFWTGPHASGLLESLCVVDDAAFELATLGPAIVAFPDRDDLFDAYVNVMLRSGRVVLDDNEALVAAAAAAPSSSREARIGINVASPRTSVAPTSSRSETLRSSRQLRVCVTAAGLNPMAWMFIADDDLGPAVVSDRIAAVPHALLQQEFFMTLEPVPNAMIEEIVDTVCLPLVSGAAKRR